MNKEYDKLPIIMLSMSRWDGPFSSASISLAKELSKKNLVFYIDNPFTIKDFFKQFNLPHIRSRKAALLFGKNIYKPFTDFKNLIAVTPRLVLPINWMTQGKIYDFFAKMNNFAVIEIIKKIKTDYKIDDYILFNSFNPFYGSNLPQKLRPALTVYQSRDDISQSVYVNKHGVKSEFNTIAQADLVMATSIGLVKKLSIASKDINYLPNAADISIFKNSNKFFKKPKELEGIEKKVIGYTGNICHRIDYQLLKEVATYHNDKILLMVGPINNQKFFEYGIDKLENVICTGSKHINLLPAYLKYMDCTIIPFHCNELTKSIYPLKINEYLAAGKPVISTSFSEDIAGFKEIIYLSENNEQFLANINKAIADADNEPALKMRIHTAEQNTWESRVNLFWQLAKDIRPCV